ncbi:mechanosensitive ion channel family protein [Oceanidesulfovibrio marinus]|uniref:Mechanosensitive ion channel n=1 Tax=Oceanidesulfovibrio marinus TaxID=370038 RepID=A0ABX6NLC2_9BACT|nr:mechanosensitive ion channel domain-containing protein [Oceanidesulfovibrio marinus]QJT10497.1 mechanosensitive ion channel [Oceanidesulfovibrio marinus]
MDLHLAATTWLVPPLVLLAGAVAGLIAHKVLHAVGKRAASSTPFAIDNLLMTHFRLPARLVLILLGMLVARQLAPLPQGIRVDVDHAFTICWIGALAWVVIAAVDLGESLLLSRFDLDKRDNLRARQIVTKLKVFKRIAVVIIIILALAGALMTFQSVRAVGASLLASAGVAGIMLGFSAQKTIATIFAGVQIALTQPIRIDDVVVVEGEWGRIEEITFTYVVVAIWDQRRLILPITYFIDHPFQNWTRTRADILGTVFLYTDYAVDIDGLRAELTRIVQEEAENLWDGRLAILQVTDARERDLELRALVSASDGSKAWDLRCLVRERLIEYLRREQPEALPRVRIEEGPLEMKEETDSMKSESSQQSDATTAPAETKKAGPE